MAWTGLPLDELREFRSGVLAAPDMRAFLDGRLADARSAATDPALSEVESPLSRICVQDLEFSGAEGHRVEGWVLTPRGVDEPLPCLVQFIGYATTSHRP